MVVRNFGFVLFRGIWFVDDIFLNIDVFEEFFDDVLFLVCKVCVCSVFMKIYSNLKKGRI